MSSEQENTKVEEKPQDEKLPKSFTVLPPIANPKIPRLVDLCVDTIIKNFTECSKLHLIPRKYQTKILQKLPLDINLSHAVMTIPDGIYWKRIVQSKYANIPHSPKMTQWKRFVLEQIASNALENATKETIDKVFEDLTVLSPFVRTIKMSRCPSKISMAKLFRTFRGLRKLTLVYGEPRRNFAQYEEFDQFTIQQEMSASQRDCTALQKDFEQIGSFCALEEFEMSDNSLTDKCAQIIGYGLIHLKRLTSITFAHNEIGNNGFQNLVQCVRSAPIRYIDVSDNKIGASGVQSLAAAVEKNTTLEYVNISSNQLSDKGVYGVSQIIEKSPSLKYLDISGNRIEHFTEIIEALKKNTTLTDFIAAANPICAEDQEIFVKFDQFNQTLQTIDVRYYPTNEEDYIVKTTETSEAPILRIK